MLFLLSIGIFYLRNYKKSFIVFFLFKLCDQEVKNEYKFYFIKISFFLSFLYLIFYLKVILLG